MSNQEVQVPKEKKPNSWISHLKQWSIQNKIPYASAISDPLCKEAYNKSKGKPTESLVSSKPKVKKSKVKKPKENIEPVEPEVVVEKKQKKKKKKKNKEVQEVAVEEE